MEEEEGPAEVPLYGVELSTGTLQVSSCAQHARSRCLSHCWLLPLAAPLSSSEHDMCTALYMPLCPL